MQILLKLYTTSHCHLCELALKLVLQQCDSKHLALVEIIHDESLFAIYGMRIPVLQRTDTLAELSWPFDAKALREFLKA